MAMCFASAPDLKVQRYRGITFGVARVTPALWIFALRYEGVVSWTLASLALCSMQLIAMSNVETYIWVVLVNF